MRRVALLLSCILVMVFSVNTLAQEKARERQRERRPPPSGQKAVPRKPEQKQPEQRRPERRPPQRPAERRRTPPPEQRAVPRQQAPRQRAVPRPPQRYDRNRRDYQRQYHYGGRWSYQPPRPYQNRYRYNRGWRVVICQPGYVIFIGYDYRYGEPVFQFFRGNCNVRGHYHDYYFYDGYR